MSAFSMREFMKRGLLGAVGTQAEYQIIQSAKEWIKKGVLESSDLEEMQAAIDALKASGEN